MKLSNVIKVWDIIHVKDVGDIGFCDLEKALDDVVGIENDIAGCRSQAIRLTGTSTGPDPSGDRR